MTENDNNLSIFEQLKNIRLEQKIDLNDVAKKSRIQVKYLEAIEAGEIEQIPEVYDKLFFQTYLSFLSLENPQSFLDEYQKLRKQSRNSPPTTTIRKIATSAVESEGMFSLKKILFVLPVVVLVFIIAFMAFHSEKVETADSKTVKELSVRDVVNEIEAKNTAVTDTTVAPAEGKPVKSASESVRVKLNVTELTWLRFIKDKSDTTEYTLTSGNILNISADSTLVFIVGNAGGVNFTINGKNEGVLGKSAEVIMYLKITNKGIVDKRMKQVAKKEVISDSLVVN
ncbi:MAG: helix-turn-helix domain-containing protein [Calditrichaceae bacterium]